MVTYQSSSENCPGTMSATGIFVPTTPRLPLPLADTLEADPAGTGARDILSVLDVLVLFCYSTQAICVFLFSVRFTDAELHSTTYMVYCASMIIL